MQENDIDKYLKGLITMNAIMGRIDVLRIYLNDTYNDSIANSTLSSIIRDLSEYVGLDYKNIEYMQNTKRNNCLNGLGVVKPKQLEKDEARKLETERAIEQLKQAEGEKQYSEQKYYNAEYDVKTNTHSIKFSNSTMAQWCAYNKNAHYLDICYNNGSIYRYYNTPMYHFDNLVSCEQNEQSVGGYINREIKTKNYKYENITDLQIG